MELNVPDHILAVILFVLLPIYGLWEYRRLKAQVKAGERGARIRMYLQTMAVEWALSLAVLGLWVLSGRSMAGLGLGFETGTGFWIGGILTLAACGFLAMQSAAVRRKREDLQALNEQLGPLRPMIPRDGRESRLFSALSITAGVCEEFLYRGYLIWYLSAHFDLWLAVVVSSLAFGLGHMYQGGRGIAKTGVVGLAFAGLYLLTGSLWASMLLHAVVDLNSGYLGKRAIEGSSAPAERTA